jgi:hypothetical protein
MRVPCRVTIGVLVASVLVAQVEAQGRPSARPATQPAPPTPDSPQASPPTGIDSTRRSANRNVTVVEIDLARASVDSITDALSQRSQGRSLSERLQSSLRTTAVGDKQKMEQLKTLVARQAQAAVPDHRVTVITVLGSAQDLDKAISSLAQVQRRVAVAFLDVTKSDERVDNTGMKAGIADAATRSLENVWVFLARNRRSPRDRPDHVLPARALTATTWNGLFAADGDAVNVSQLRGVGAGRGSAAPVTALTSSAGTASSEAAMSASTIPASTIPASFPFAKGDVVTPRIGGMKVYREASASSVVAGSAARGDEFVVEDGALVNGMVRVAGNVSGWVNPALLKKP